ncbi:MAG: BlaI/MecI/CopY family transcriptional regulator [Planctomycetes bacterium]|nr:BlaI/MecI/CopY family transcriptional regulator [Planctomycetota bacterium]
MDRSPGARMPPHESDLGTAELEVLRTLWDHGPATVREVMNQLHEAGRKVAYTTVLTFLTRLEQKGFVRSDKSGLAYVYRPKVTREKVSSSRLKSLIRELYDGAAAPLILQLVREERLSSDEVAELQKLIDELDTPRPRRKGRS